VVTGRAQEHPDIGDRVPGDRTAGQGLGDAVGERGHVPDGQDRSSRASASSVPDPGASGSTSITTSANRLLQAVATAYR
jgi:hypothetical protein